MGYKLTRYEMETTINFNAEEGSAVLYTRDKAVMRRLDKLVAEFPDIYKQTDETSVGKTYTFPKRYAFPKRPRILSEERRAQMRDILAKAREQNQNLIEEDEDLMDEEDDFLEEDNEE